MAEQGVTWPSDTTKAGLFFFLNHITFLRLMSGRWLRGKREHWWQPCAIVLCEIKALDCEKTHGVFTQQWGHHPWFNINLYHCVFVNLPWPFCSSFSLLGKKKNHLLFIPMPVSKLKDSADPGSGLCFYFILHPSIWRYHGYSSNCPVISGLVYPLSICQSTHHPRIHPPIHLSTHPSIHPSFH